MEWGNLALSSCAGILIAKDKESNSKLRLLPIERNESAFFVVSSQCFKTLRNLSSGLLSTNFLGTEKRDFCSVLLQPLLSSANLFILIPVFAHW